VRGALGAFSKLSKATINLNMSVPLSAWNSLVPTRWMFMLIPSIFRKSLEKIQVLIKIGQEYRVLYMKTNIHLLSYLSVLLRMGNVRTKVLEKIKINFLCSITFFENSAFYEMICKNIVEPCRSHENLARLQIHTDDYVIIIAFSLQQCLHLRVSMLRYTYTSLLF
jgi:hypothetical protein